MIYKIRPLNKEAFCTLERNLLEHNVTFKRVGDAFLFKAINPTYGDIFKGVWTGIDANIEAQDVTAWDERHVPS